MTERATKDGNRTKAPRRIPSYLGPVLLGESDAKPPVTTVSRRHKENGTHPTDD